MTLHWHLHLSLCCKTPLLPEACCNLQLREARAERSNLSKLQQKNDADKSGNTAHVRAAHSLLGNMFVNDRILRNTPKYGSEMKRKLIIRGICMETGDNSGVKCRFSYKKRPIYKFKTIFLQNKNIMEDYIYMYICFLLLISFQAIIHNLFDNNYISWHHNMCCMFKCKYFYLW